ncbi:MAG: response regulator [Proteobacteria bacterium]|nr:response regulator [Pseudomonadota bacterium]MBU4130941.1 response regulator [Pseudomonadota bacterium]
MNINSHLLGDLLVSMGIISRSQLEEALRFQQLFFKDVLPETDLDRTELISRGRNTCQKIPMLGQILVKKGYVTEEELAPALQIQSKRATDLSLLDSDKLATALEVGFIINSTINLVDVLSLIMKYANIVTDSVASTLMLLDDKTGELVFSIPTGPDAGKLEDIRIPSGEGIAGWVAKNEQYLLVPDTSKDARFYAKIDALTGMTTKSLLCVPMKSKRKLIGVLEVINKKNDSCFGEADALLLSVFSHHAAIAIENAMLFKSMQNRLEKEKLLEQKFSESERLRSIGTMAGGIAHDFNNILAAIMGYTELALLDAQEDSKQSANLTNVLGASRRARDLIKQILAFSRQSDRETKPIQANLIVGEALKLFRASLPKTIEMQDNIHCKSVVMGDPTQIHQVIMNLCTNASQAIKKTGGVLAVSLEEVFLEEQAERPDLLPGFYLNLRVTDNGEGMSSRVAERIFEPFFTTKEKGQGTGMGLAVVHGIVKSHGGDIQVTSKPGEGSCFDVYLPVIKRDPEPAGIFAVETSPGGTEHILVVDDEIMLLDVAKTRLNSLGYQVTIEMDSHEALKRFKQSPETYDLVITDMAMPKMAGDKMAKKMMAIRPDIPVIICTGFHEDISEETARQKGFKRFLMKPVDFNNLALEVRRVLDELF